MADTIISPNMNLPIPVVGVDAGPDWANNINSALGILDGHSHQSDSGVPITPDGMNISKDLPFLGNKATQLGSARFTSLTNAITSASPDIGCAYNVLGNLYWNDNSGNQIQITSGGAVAGTPGSIANLVSPASASYVALSSTFVWQSAVSTAANMDFASAILRNSSASSKGLTLNPPSAMASDITMTLNVPPAATSFLTMDSSGNFISSIAVAGGITRTMMAAIGQQTSSSCGSASTSATSYTDVTNLSISITTSGKPVWVGLMWDGSSTISSIEVDSAVSGTGAVGNVRFVRGATALNPAEFRIDSQSASSQALRFSWPVTSYFYIDPVGAGTYTYKAQFQIDSASNTISINGAILFAYEL